MQKRRVSRHEVTQPLDKSYRLIPLTQGQNAIVDAADFEWLSQWNWYADWSESTRSFYAKRTASGPTVRMHREILGCANGEEADHVNHDTLDNRRRNLRKCTKAQNARNRITRSSSSGERGVTPSCNGKWKAEITIHKRKIYLGLFACKEAAVQARKKSEMELFEGFVPPIHRAR